MSYIDLEDEDLINADENELLAGDENALIDDNEYVPEQNGEDEAVDTAPSKDAVKVAPKKRTARPQPKLNYDRLKGPRGLLVLESAFKDVKFKGKGHEKEDLAVVMTGLEQWAHRLFPKFTFDDTLERLEQLGRKKIVSNFLNRIRLDMVDDSHASTPNDTAVANDEDEPPADPFDRLVPDEHRSANSTQTDRDQGDRGVQQSVTLTDEQRERMIRNRLLAEERRMARMKAKQQELVQQRHSQMELDERVAQFAQNDARRAEQSQNRDEPDEASVRSQVESFDFLA